MDHTSEEIAVATTEDEPLVGEAEHLKLDELERAMLASGAPVVNMPVVHRFTPGLYIREIHMPARALLTSKIHNAEHPFVVTEGVVRVYIPGQGVEEIAAPHVGITKPGTRRVLYIVKDCTWLTFHPLVGDEGVNGEADLPRIEQRIIERRELEDGKSAYELYAEALRALTGLEPGQIPVEHELDGLPGQDDYVGAP